MNTDRSGSSAEKNEAWDIDSSTSLEEEARVYHVRDWGGRRGSGRLMGPGLRGNHYCVTAPGSESFNANDPPLASLAKVILTPAIVFALTIAVLIWDGRALSGSDLLLAAFASAISALVFGEANFYREFDRYPIRVGFFDILTRWSVFAAIFGLLGYATRSHVHFSYEGAVVGIVLAPFALLASHMLARTAVRKLMSSSIPRTAVIAGATPLSNALGEGIKNDAFLNVEVAGFFDDRQNSRLPQHTQSRHLGNLNDLPNYVKQHSVELIYICLPIMWQARILKVLDGLRDTTASIYFVPDIFMADLIQARIDRIGGMPTIALCETPFIGKRGVIKRWIDVVISLLILLIGWPLFALLAIGVKLSSPGGVFYKQERYGLDGKRILVYKFRTMYVCERGANVIQARRADDRVTKFGRILRQTSLDELPQILNVLGGSMSLVGPRPHAVYHNELYRKAIKGYMVRHKVRPGITGWAQVNGFRGETDTLDKMEARVQYDIDYLRNWSLTLDALIMLKTIRVVFGQANAY